MFNLFSILGLPKIPGVSLNLRVRYYSTRLFCTDMSTARAFIIESAYPHARVHCCSVLCCFVLCCAREDDLVLSIVASTHLVVLQFSDEQEYRQWYELLYCAGRSHD